MALAKPQRLGPYELSSHIATGGMAEVYVARREGPHGFQKTVAVKRIIPQLAQDPEFVAMFVDEARVSAHLSHPNIVQVFDFGEDEGELYMAMEFVQGTSTAKLIRAISGRPQLLPLDATFHLILSVLRALDYAHTAVDEEGTGLHLVHRDVSPGNILLHASGAVKLTDFGIARAARIERRTDAGQLKGKLGYMSPEQVVGRELDPRSDLFTLAVVFAELLTGEPLFAGQNELDVLMRIRDADLRILDRAHIPEDVRSVLLQALARKPKDRFEDAAAFASALEDVIRRRRMPVAPSALAQALMNLNLVGGSREYRLAPQPDTESLLPPIDTAAGGAIPVRAPEEELRSTVIPPVRAEGGSARMSLPSTPLPTSWTLRLGDDVRPGLTYPEVIELLVTGKVPAESAQFSKEGSPFQVARGYPELSRFVTSPALAWTEHMPTGVIDRKMVDRATLPSRLYYLAVNRETGALLLQSGEKKKKIFFVDGVPEYVASTDRTELLGECLVRRGQVLRMEVDMALAMLSEFDGKLGDALVGLGVLRPIELFRAVLDQTQDRIVEAFSWSDGEIAFLPGARCQEETLPLGVKPFELISRGICEHYGYVELGEILERVGNDSLERVAPLPVRVESFRLPEREERVLQSIEGRITRSDLEDRAVRENMATPDEVARAIFFGLSCDILRTPRWRGFVSSHPRR